MDHDALVSRLLALRLQAVPEAQYPAIVRDHWADFDLYGEDVRIDDLKLREAYRTWLDDAVHGGSHPEMPGQLRSRLDGILVAVAVRFEGRAKLFRDVPSFFALQIIVSTGVINGMLVARSVDTCAKLVECLIKNDLQFKLQPDADNYRLVEVTTGSTARVISRHTLITNAFSSFYSMTSRPQ